MGGDQRSARPRGGGFPTALTFWERASKAVRIERSKAESKYERHEINCSDASTLRLWRKFILSSVEGLSANGEFQQTVSAERG
jgi:hypothetical protein